MANLNLRRPQNVNGDFYVDSSCIDCDTCRWMTPEVFNRLGNSRWFIINQKMKFKDCDRCKHF
jgi:hypothetical protein